MTPQTVTVKFAIDSSQFDEAVQRVKEQIDEVADLAEKRLGRFMSEFERQYERVDQILGKDET